MGLILMLGLLASNRAQSASATNDSETSLADLSIEELVNIQIMSVSKKEAPLLQSPAAVAVLTGDDITRLGVNSIPEALRAVPGVQVARVNANKWAISARGLNDEFANKLLVLVDGRSVYTPTFGGVYWDTQDLVLEDLDRIEVIRGPGATLWGANAVNGVINVITKSAKETQGLLVSTAYGTEARPLVTARYGGQLASNLFYRVYVKYFDRAGFEDENGGDMGDAWSMSRGGLRLDWEPNDQNSLTLLGDYYDGRFGEQVGKTSVYPPAYETLNVRAPESSGNVLGRWTHKFSEDSEFQLRVYFDHYRRQHPYGGGVLIASPDEFVESQNLMGEHRDTWDVDLQHRVGLGSRQDVVWGLGYRHTEDEISSAGADIFWATPQREDDLFSAFLQDEITVVDERLRLMLGSKFEHNDYTGFEVQPGARLTWTPTEHQTYWASVARAVRTPARLEQDARVNVVSFALPDSTPVMVSAFGNPEAKSEELLAYELGWRFQPVRQLSFDVAAFYNDYSLLLAVPAAPGFELEPAPPHLLQSYTYGNGVKGSTYGTELLAQWRATERLRLSAGYSWLHTSIEDDPSATRGSPENQIQLRASLDLGRGWELNSTAYFVDQIQSVPQGTTEITIPAYVRMDLGLGWKPNDHLEISVWGQNLLDDSHPEFASYKTGNIAEISRTFYGKITCWF